MFRVMILFLIFKHISVRENGKNTLPVLLIHCWTQFYIYIYFGGIEHIGLHWETLTSSKFNDVQWPIDIRIDKTLCVTTI